MTKSVLKLNECFFYPEENSNFFTLSCISIKDNMSLSSINHQNLILEQISFDLFDFFPKYIKGITEHNKWLNTILLMHKKALFWPEGQKSLV